MLERNIPFGVRLIGFGAAEAGQLCAMLALAPAAGPAYFCLHDDSLQEPDLYIANADDVGALARLSDVGPGTLQPVLLVGNTVIDLPMLRIERPLSSGRLHQMMVRLVEQRATALAIISARGLPQFIERRRNKRLDFDLTDPSEYVKRRREPPGGAVLVVDKHPALSEHMATLFPAGAPAIRWADSAPAALRACSSSHISLVFINTSTPAVNPYALCAAIKELPQGSRTAVVLLVGGSFKYEASRARAAGVRGLLDKPVEDRHFVAVVKRILSLPV